MNRTIRWMAGVAALFVAAGMLAGCQTAQPTLSVIPAVTTTATAVPTTTATTTTTTATTTTTTTTTAATTTTTITTTITTTVPTTTTTFVDDGSGTALVRSVFGEDTVERLMALDNTRRGWGQGVQFDEKNRPHGSLYAQKQYGKYDAYYIMPEEQKLYLTFDEGYENGYTAAILDTLKEKGVSAVFFVTLSYAKRNPQLMRRMINEGHIVGNHSAAHPSYPTLTLDEAYADAKALHDYVKDTYGYEMTLFRFPAGEASDRMLALLQEMGYTSLFWSYAYADWDPNAQKDPAETLETVLKRAHPGALYLLHAVSSTNAEILGDAIDGWRKAGYELALPNIAE